MKKLITTVIIALISVSAFCQTAQEVIDRYNQVSGFDNINLDKGSVMMDLSMDTPMGKMPMQLIKAPGNKYRIEMTTSGQEILIVADGKFGWVKVGGQVQPLPMDQLAQFTSQGDMASSLKMDNQNFDYTLVGQTDTQIELKGTPKESVKKIGLKESSFFFDKASGMLVKNTSKVEMNGKVLDVTTTMNDVKEFGQGLKMPSKMDILMTGMPKMSMIINKFETNYPAEAWMFVEPTK